MREEKKENEPNLDQQLLALAILRDDLYATRSIVRDHHIDPLEANIGTNYSPEAVTFKGEEEVNIDYGEDLPKQITQKSQYPLWGYIGFKLHTVDLQVRNY